MLSLWTADLCDHLGIAEGVVQTEQNPLFAGFVHFYGNYYRYVRKCCIFSLPKISTITKTFVFSSFSTTNASYVPWFSGTFLVILSSVIRHKLPAEQPYPMLLMRRTIVSSVVVAVFVLLSTLLRAETPGKDGDKCVMGREVVNRYSTLSAGVLTGTSFITVANIVNLAPVSPGDLLLLHQETSDALAAQTELVVVHAVNGNTITLVAPVQNAYSHPRAVQVVLVPQYASLTVPDGSSIIAGSAGIGFAGIVAVRVSGSVVVNGTISARSASSLDDPDSALPANAETAPASPFSSRGLILLLVPKIIGHGTVHAYSGKSFDLDSDDCSAGDCDGVVIVGGKTTLLGITIHAKEIHFAGVMNRH